MSVINSGSSRILGDAGLALLFATVILVACGDKEVTGTDRMTSQNSAVTVDGSAPDVSITMVPPSVAMGETSTISWTSTNSISCLSSAGGGAGTKGTFTTPPIMTDSYYTVLCIGAGGNTSKTVVVTVTPVAHTPSVIEPSANQEVTRPMKATTQPSKSVILPSKQAVTAAVDANAPTVTIAATPSVITYGARSTINWTSTNTTACTSSGGGGTGTKGSFTVTALATNARYSVTCTGPEGSVTRSTTVIIGAFTAPVVTFTATPASIVNGGRSTISWTSTNSTHCVSSGGGGGDTSGTFITPALTTNTTYSVICTGDGGTASKVLSIALSRSLSREIPVPWVLSD